MARRRRRGRGTRTLSGAFHRWIVGLAYWLGAGVIMTLFGVASQNINLQLTLGTNTYDFGFVIGLMGLGLGGFLLFKGARHIGVRV